MIRLAHCATIVLASTIFLVSLPASAGTCKLSIILDRSGSMRTPRLDGSGDTRCKVASQAASDAVAAFANGNLYKVNEGEKIENGDVYDLNCPLGPDGNVAAGSSKLVSVWMFEGSLPPIVTGGLINVTNGFVDPDAAIGALQRSPAFNADAAHPDLLVPKECPSGATPLAQGMFEAARVFGPPLTAPLPAGEIRRAVILTDGDENYSDEVTLPSGSMRIRLPGDPADSLLGDWAVLKMKDEYNRRDVDPTGFLFEDPGIIALRVATTRIGDLDGPSGQVVSLAAATPNRGYPVASDIQFFTRLAAQTGGTFEMAPDTSPLAAQQTLIDSDGDGIPDFRDLCDAPGCVDGDGDGIPTVIDQCRTSQEDGRGANPGDGCPDTDADGIPNSRDACPTKFEDYVLPNPTDGCPVVAVASAVPAAPAGHLAMLALGVAALGMVALRRTQAPRRIHA